MLDYASNCQAHWTADAMRESLAATCAAAGTNADEALERLLEPGTSPEALWVNVKRNLQAGRLRMLFVADEIPSELRRIVEFLNEQMDPAEILAIELRQFAGEGLRTVVPTLFGQTQEAAATPGARWTEERFLAAIDDRFGEGEAAAARAVLAWMKTTGRALTWGTGRENGSVSPLLRPRGINVNPAYLSTEGKIWLQLNSLKDKPVFGEIETRREMLRKFGQVAGSDLAGKEPDGWASLALATVAADPDGVPKVIAAFEWLLAQVKTAG